MDDMKRSRTEHIHSVLGSYLRKRQFSENDLFKKNEMKLQQSTQEMATRGSIMFDSSLRNVINFSNISFEPAQIENQFIKLKTFIGEAVEPFKTELSYILYPIFIHLYLELLKNSTEGIAQKFYQHHHSLFSSTVAYIETMESLKKISSIDDLPQYPSVKAFRENKFIVQLTENCLQYLLRFLRENDNLLLLQIFNIHIDIKEPKSIKLHLYEEKDSSASDVSISNSNPKSLESTQTKSSPNSSMKSLHQAIKKVRDGLPPFPSVCLYTLMNTNRGVSCTQLNQDVTALATGWEDSVIRVWNLTPTSSNSSHPSTNDCGLQLGCDIAIQSEESFPSANHEEKILRGHSGTVHGLCFAPDSSLMLSCSEDTTVRAWDLNTCTSVALYRGHNYPVWDIDYSSIGVYFATASHDRTAKLWCLDRAYPVRHFAGHSMDVDSIRFHPNCNYIATGSSDRTVRLWSVQDGKMVRMFQGHRGTVFTLAFSPNGQYLASAGEDRRVKVWDLASGTLFKELRGHMDTVYSLCFNRDSSILVSAGLDSNIKVWDIRKSATYGSALDGHTSPELIGSCIAKSISLLTVHYSAKNLLIAVGNCNGNLS